MERRDTVPMAIRKGLDRSAMKAGVSALSIVFLLDAFAPRIMATTQPKVISSTNTYRAVMVSFRKKTPRRACTRGAQFWTIATVARLKCFTLVKVM